MKTCTCIFFFLSLNWKPLVSIITTGGTVLIGLGDMEKINTSITIFRTFFLFFFTALNITISDKVWKIWLDNQTFIFTW